MIRSTKCFLPLLILLAPAVLPLHALTDEATPPRKIEGTANTDPVPVADPDEAILATIVYPEGMEARVFAKQPDVLNPTALTIDEQNRVLVAETHRFGRGIEDNRRNGYWLREEIALQTTAGRLAMYEHHADRRPLEYYTQHAEKIRLLEDTDDDGHADHSQLFADGFNEPLDGTAAGIMAANGKVYFACIPHVWMLEDTNDDGVSDQRKSLQEGYGISVSLSGHDLNGFSFGPDGRIYFTIGDRGYNLHTADGRILNSQYSGAVFRMEPDGSGLEVVHAGLRNPKEIAFNAYGEAFSVDNNADMGDEARLVAVVEGADSGWTRGHQNLRNFRHVIDVSRRHQIPWMAEGWWELEGEDRPQAHLPAIAHLSTGPSGLAYHPGTSLGKKWDDHFFVCDYKGGSSRVIGFRVGEAGAGFKLAHEEDFISGFLNTDIEFGYDGKIYVSDFTGGWKTYEFGAIYVFHDPQQTAKPVIREVRQLFAEGFDQRSPQQLAELLGHPDLRVRQRAQFALANDPQHRSVLIDASRTTQPLVTRLHGVWGLGQLARSHDDDDSIEALLTLATDANRRVCGEAIRILGEVAPQRGREAFVAAVTAGHPRTRMLAAIALGKAGKPADAPALVNILRASADPYLRHGAIYGLEQIARTSGSTQPLMAFSTDPSTQVRRGLVIALRRLGAGTIAGFLNDADAGVVRETIQAINDAEIESARPALARAAKDLLGRFPPMMDYRILNAVFRVGGTTNARRLVATAAEPSLPPDTRIEALFLLRRWDNPPPADPTTGKHRPLPAGRDLQPVAGEVEKLIGSLLGNSEGSLLAEVMVTAKHFGVPVPPVALRGHLENPENPTDVRLAALDALRQSQDEHLLAILGKTVADPDAAVRGASLEALMTLDPEAFLKVAEKILAARKVAPSQQVLGILAKASRPRAIDLVREAMDDFTAQPAGLKLDLLMAAEAHREVARIGTLLKRWEASLDPDDPLAAYRVAEQGGDLGRGRRIFYNHGAAQCTRCHVGDPNRKGGNAGPALDSIGTQRDASYLVEALVLPGARIAPGYGLVSLTLNDGRVVAGRLIDDGDDAVVIEDLTEGQPTRYPRDDIQTFSSPMSTMPPMAGILTKAEIRDVVAYLQSLQHPPAED